MTAIPGFAPHRFDTGEVARDAAAAVPGWR
jgi:hypothetical protein